MTTLLFGKINLVFMLLPRCLLLVRMIAGVVLRSFYFVLLHEFWDRGGWMWSMICVCVPWMWCSSFVGPPPVVWDCILYI